MAYIALYRKWRPKTFTDVVGQKQVSETLMRAIRENKVAHAYLFSGPRGTGKTSLAKIFARAMNCEHGPTDTPCNKCKACLQLLNGDSMDVIEIDAASNRGIDEIRALRENAKFLPVDGRKKIFIIDEAHMLTNEAWNALLKTIEEPPEHVMFIFATTEYEKLPVTIISRCQRYGFRRISVEDMTKHLLFVAQNSNIEITETAAQLIAVQADGGLRDALSILDQCSGMAKGEITVEHVVDMMGLVGKEQVVKLYQALNDGNGALILEMIKSYISEGREPIQMVEALAEHIRALLLYKVLPKADELKVYERQRDQFETQAKEIGVRALNSLMYQLQKIQADAKTVDQPRLVVEMGLLSLCANMIATKDDIQDRLSTVEMNQARSWENIIERLIDIESNIKSGVSINKQVLGHDDIKSNITVEIQKEIKQEPKSTLDVVDVISQVKKVAPSAKQGRNLAADFQAMTMRASKKTQSSQTKVNLANSSSQAIITDSAQNPKSFKATTRYLIENLEVEGNHMQASFLKRGILVYLDDYRMVFTFKGKTAINILKCEPGYSIIKRTVEAFLHREIVLEFLEDKDSIAEEYKEASKRRINDEYSSIEIKEREISKPEVAIKKESIVESAFQTPIEEEFVAVTGFDEIPPPLDEDSGAIEIELATPRQSIETISDDAIKCTLEHVKQVEQDDPAFGTFLNNTLKTHDIYIEYVDD